MSSFHTYKLFTFLSFFKIFYKGVIKIDGRDGIKGGNFDLEELGDFGDNASNTMEPETLSLKSHNLHFKN